MIRRLQRASRVVLKYVTYTQYMMYISDQRTAKSLKKSPIGVLQQLWLAKFPAGGRLVFDGPIVGKSHKYLPSIVMNEVPVGWKLSFIWENCRGKCLSSLPSNAIDRISQIREQWGACACSFDWQGLVTYCLYPSSIFNWHLTNLLKCCFANRRHILLLHLKLVNAKD